MSEICVFKSRALGWGRTDPSVPAARELPAPAPLSVPFITGELKTLKETLFGANKVIAKKGKRSNLKMSDCV